MGRRMGRKVRLCLTERMELGPDRAKERSSSQPSGLTSSQRSTGSTIFEPSDDEEGSRGSADEVSSDEDDDGGVDHDSERSGGSQISDQKDGGLILFLADAHKIGNGVDVGTSTDRKRARGQQSSSGVKRVEKRGREEGSSVCQSKKVAKRG